MLVVKRRAQAGQSAIIAVIVLFLLLFLGAIFVALIANNLRSTQNAVNVSASGRFAEAGINYLDQQLTGSPDGADWRPTPDSLDPALNPGVRQDPDYYWLQKYNPTTGLGGYTRINFGGATPGSVGPSGTSGGRALVRVTYKPSNPGQTLTETDRISKYIKLESIGRVGQVDPQDPTTFGNTEAVGQRTEQVAFKQIGLTDYVLQTTNIDNKPVTATLGAPYSILDRGGNRNIETIVEGPVRFNSNLTFYGTNRFFLDPNRNDAIEVAGLISLNNVPDKVNTATPPTGANQAQVFVNKMITTGTTAATPNLFPSLSPNFTTYFPTSPTNTALVAGLVRDNRVGNDTGSLPADTGPDKLQPDARNLRAVPHLAPPLIDAATGPNGLTRYRALTRDSAPLDQGFATANPITALGANAGQYGWGQGLYINNLNNLQMDSESLVGGYSLRANWLGENPQYWVTEDRYEPPAVTIILTPRYMIIRRSAEDVARGARGSYFRAPNNANGLTPGQRIGVEEIVRYTAGSTTTMPIIGVSQSLRYEGYPAAAITGVTKTFGGDFVVFAEGNIRIRGVVGGLDPETKDYFVRHLTVVSGNGNIYVDGSVLRDNITPEMANADPSAKYVSGKSSIALLAKNYITVNTTQFLSPGTAAASTEQRNNTAPAGFELNSNPENQTFPFRVTFGPEDARNTAPRYLTQQNLPGGAPTPMTPGLFMRHDAENGKSAIQIGVNQNLNSQTGFAQFNYMDVATLGYATPANDPMSLLLASQFDANAATTPSLKDHYFNIPTNYLFGVGTNNPQAYPFTNPPGTNATTPSIIGQDNFLQLEYSTNADISTQPYVNTRIGVAPLDIRIEALMYAQQGSFFIIPGPWFNPDPNDTYEQFISGMSSQNGNGLAIPGRRSGQNQTTSTGAPDINHLYPFYKESQDVRMTFYGSITQNLPAEVGDQGAWLEKWGWVPDYYGSTGLTGAANYPVPPQNSIATSHGRKGYLNYIPYAQLAGGVADGTGGSGIIYQFDPRAVQPYYDSGSGVYVPIRPNPYFSDQPLPLMPRLPVAPGLLYYGQSTNLPQ